MELLWGDGGYTFRPYIPQESGYLNDPLPPSVSITGVTPYMYRYYWGPMGPLRNPITPAFGSIVMDEYVAASDSKTATVLHMAPEMKPYSLYKDTQRYGGFFSNLTYLNSVLTASKKPGRGKEHEVVHATVSGRCGHEASNVFSTAVVGPDILGTPTAGYDMLGEPTLTGPYGKPDWLAPASSHYLGGLDSILHSYEEYLNVGGTSLLYDWWPSASSRYRCWISGVSHQVTSESTLITFTGTYRIDQPRYNKILMGDLYYAYEIVVAPGLLNLGVGSLYGADTSIRTLVAGQISRHEVRVVTYHNRPTSEFVCGDPLDMTVTWPLGVSVQSQSTSDEEVSTAAFMSFATSLDQFIDHNRSYLVDSCVVSSSNAVDDFRSFMDTNYLESISEITALLDLIPDKGPLVDFLRMIPAGKWVQGVLRLADFAANTYLLTKFGLMPFINDIQIFADGFDRIADIVRQRLGNGYDARGKLVYTFGQDTVFKDWTLVTRSKVRIRIPPGSIAASLLPLSAAGLEPSSSQAWDLAPWSFAVDWITRIGDKLNMADNAAFVAVSVVDYCVHSYSMYTALTPSNLLGTGLVPLGSVQYKNYWRTSSRFYPNIMQTYAYDWWMGGDVPQLIAGALVWTVVRS
jgi:hypothetical protein